MPPRVGSRGSRPSPRKLRLASARMTAAMPDTAWVRSTGKTSGRTCCVAMCREGALKPRAARMKSCSLIFRTSPRTRRAVPPSRRRPGRVISGSRSRPPRGDQEQGQQEAGEGQREIGGAHDGGAEAAAVPAGQIPQREPGSGGQGDHDQGDGQRGQRAAGQAGEHVAPEGVGAQQVAGRRRLQALPQMSAPGRSPRPGAGRRARQRDRPGAGPPGGRADSPYPVRSWPMRGSSSG